MTTHSLAPMQALRLPIANMHAVYDAAEVERNPRSAPVRLRAIQRGDGEDS